MAARRPESGAAVGEGIAGGCYGGAAGIAEVP
jgi:hypothetical protein